MVLVDHLLPVSTSAHHMAGVAGALTAAYAASLQPISHACCSTLFWCAGVVAGMGALPTALWQPAVRSLA